MALNVVALYMIDNPFDDISRAVTAMIAPDGIENEDVNTRISLKP